MENFFNFPHKNIVWKNNGTSNFVYHWITRICTITYNLHNNYQIYLKLSGKTKYFYKFTSHKKPADHTNLKHVWRFFYYWMKFLFMYKKTPSKKVCTIYHYLFKKKNSFFFVLFYKIPNIEFLDDFL